MYVLDQQLQQDTVQLGQFPLCDVLLMKDANYPWVILVPRQASIREAYHLSSEDQYRLSDESTYVSQRMADFFKADSMNVAALGNVVSQLHVHHVVRKQEDPTWPKPVWGAMPAKPYDQAELDQLVTDLKRLFDDKLQDHQPTDDDSALY